MNENKQYTLPRFPKRNPEIETLSLNDEIVLLDPVTGTIARLNDAAYFVWLSAAGHTSIEEIAEQLVQLTGDRSGKAEADVTECIKRFAAGRFLMARDESVR